MKLTKATILALTVAMLLTASPTFAASAGRIGGSNFRSRSSSPSYSRPSSPSYSRRGSSPSYSSPRSPSISSPSHSYSAPRTYTPLPVLRPPYNPPSRSSTNIIVMPDLTPNVVPAIPYSLPSRVTTVSQQPANPIVLLALLTSVGVVIIAVILLLGGWEDFVSPWLSTQKEKYKKLTVVRQRVALLASAKDIQSDLIRMAEQGDTNSPNGLAKILQETTLALLRHPDKVVYAWSDKNRESLDNAEDLFNQFSMEERSRASEETLTNVNGRVFESKVKSRKKTQENEYILVNVLVVTYENLDLKPSDSQENLKSNLVVLGSISAEDLVALEIIWQPEDEYDVLSKEELLTLYPDLNIL
jgi:uncharacterized membrane protein